MSLGPWDPLTVEQVTELLAAMPAPWWIAGGWALDLYLGRVTRAHSDVDVVVLRPDLLKVQDALDGWDLQAADPPGTLRPWMPGEVLAAHVHDIWCRRAPDVPWSFQLMVDDVVGDEWIFRRDPRLKRSILSLSGPASDGQRQVLAPEVQLLYKSGTPRPKDEADFEGVLPALTDNQRTWLAEALQLVSPGHPWIQAL